VPNKLGDAFLQDLHADWQMHGRSVIERVRRDDPSTYLCVMASVDRLETGQITVLEVRGDASKTDVTYEVVRLVLHQIAELNELLADEDEADTEADAKGHLPSTI
jgi:hypothetical protein